MVMASPLPPVKWYPVPSRLLSAILVSDPLNVPTVPDVLKLSPVTKVAVSSATAVHPGPEKQPMTVILLPTPLKT
jgi:hypothetical protein